MLQAVKPAVKVKIYHFIMFIGFSLIFIFKLQITNFESLLQGMQGHEDPDSCQNGINALREICALMAFVLMFFLSHYKLRKSVSKMYQQHFFTICMTLQVRRRCEHNQQIIQYVEHFKALSGGVRKCVK